ncbi:hypothetical protein M407DRAFT_246437 [Tulasnella calospora MUT 4182]|uniref:Uncharacterized protein n=1 Tax=Tulasnella calospora MUT 4182 TaxID=1051891 RepID=A0A0C3LAR5_9AGAM|nr:hypothetical protein M407DRAFT_246437 [Tulasnella calospora MUT 4182]
MAEITVFTWGDILMFFATIFGVFGVSVASWWIYNAIYGTLWQTKKTLKDRGVEKGEDGVWRVKTDKTLSHETEVDKTQRGIVKAMEASSFGNAPKGKKGGKAE